MIEERQTQTARVQRRLEKKLLPVHEAFRSGDDNDRLEALRLRRDDHVAYLRRHFGDLPQSYAALDASQPWMLYWNLHALALLDADLPEDVGEDDVVEFLKRCWCEEGGYGGGPRQLPHLATTYATVMTLMTIGTKEAYESIDREKLQEFLLSMCVPEEKGGGMTVHQDGEVDVRGCYCAMAVAHVLNLDKQRIAEQSDMINFIRRCQSFEGGLGGEPGNEAHGGYTFCGLAALHLLDRMDVLNIASLLKWAVHMQGSFEGGFVGRTHKLVDGCYSYWQGAIFSLLKPYISDPYLWSHLVPNFELPEGLDDLPLFEDEGEPLPHHEAARDEAERCLQSRAEELHLDLKQALNELSIDASSLPFDRRLRMDLFRSTSEKCQMFVRSVQSAFSVMYPIEGDDDPSRQSLVGSRDTHRPDASVLYDILGLQFWVLLHCQTEEGGLRDKPNKEADLYHTCYCLSGLAIAQQYGDVVVGPEENALRHIDPVLNILTVKARSAVDYYGRP